MLSRDCDGCSQLKACGKRYGKVCRGEKVYCPDGTAHLIDEATQCHIELCEKFFSRQSAPIAIEHSLVARGASAAFDSLGFFGSGEDGWDVIATFEPGVGCVEYFRIGSQAVEYFAKEPFG